MDCASCAHRQTRPQREDSALHHGQQASAPRVVAFAVAAQQQRRPLKTQLLADAAWPFAVAAGAAAAAPAVHPTAAAPAAVVVSREAAPAGPGVAACPALPCAAAFPAAAAAQL